MNPIVQLLNLAQSGGNPMALLQQMAGGNPRIAQGLQMVQGKNVQQLQAMAQNMCRERGVTVEQVLQQWGINLPNGRMQ